MQSGYGGVSEFQQFMMDGGFAMSAPPQPGQAAAAAAAAAGGQELGAPFRYQPLHHHALPQHHHAPPQMPPHFAHFGGAGPASAGGIPFTQQLLHQAAAAGHHHHLQLFHEQHHHKPQPSAPARWAPQHHHPHHHLGFDVEAAVPESSGAGGGSAEPGAAAPPGVPPFLAAAMSFKLAVDAGGGTDDALNDGGGGGSGMMLHGGGDDEAATENRLRRWPGDEEASIKEPTWRPLDIDYIHSTKRAPGKEKAATPESPAPAAAANYFKKGDDNAAAASAGGGNYKLFSELEAIYKPGSGGSYPFVSSQSVAPPNHHRNTKQKAPGSLVLPYLMAPALSRSLGASSVAALRPSPSRGPLRGALVPQGRLVGVRCDAAVAEKPAGEEEEAAGEKFEYQAEVSRLLDLIVHSLYSHKEVFLRELVSNASDALDKLRFLSVTDPSVLADGGELEIRIKPDPEAGTITITDTGIGMTKDELKDCLGTIAQSGTSKFLKALKENKDLGADNGLIGQFGVGFYSAFLVAEKVVVSTKSPKSDKQYVWEAVADSSSYIIKEETDPEKMLTRGTQITLFLSDDDKYEFADPARIQGLVKNYSQFVSFPIYTWQEKSRTVEVEEEEESKEDEEATEGEKKKKKKTITEKYWDWELANETKPIWMRSPKEVEKTEYNEFYKKTFNEFLDPLAYTHFTTEGEVEFRSVLYIPGMAPLSNEEIMNPKTKNIRLYVKRVFISDDFDGELFPRYLSFVKGVVDSNDLPLNVSREILQESRIVRIMRKRLVRKTFDMIQEIAEKDDKEDYKKFWESFGKFMKLGCIEDTGNQKRLAPLLRFQSSKNETDLISLDQYVENMPDSQKAIYYIATDSLQSAKTAPFLEKLVQKDIEVLYLIEPIDEVAIQNLQTYKEKKFVDISKEDLELGDEDEDKEKESKQEYTLLCDWIKQQLGDKVAKVQISKRLSSSPCVLVSGKFGWSANMERLMKAQTLGDTSSLEFMRGRRIFEINPDHPIIKDLNAACKNEPESTEAKRAVELLYETALISSGYTPDSPAELGGKIYEMMTVALGGRWGRSNTELAEATTDETNAESDSSEGAATEVVEPSEVRTESDPWKD